MKRKQLKHLKHTGDYINRKDGYCENMTQQPSLPWEPYRGYGLQYICKWAYAFADDKRGVTSEICMSDTDIPTLKKQIDEFFNPLREYVSRAQAVLAVAKETNQPEPTLTHLNKIIQVTELIVSSEQNHLPEKQLNELVGMLVEYVYPWFEKMGGDNVDETYGHEYVQFVMDLFFNINNRYLDTSEPSKKILAEFDAMNKYLLAEQEENERLAMEEQQKQEQLEAEEEERKRLETTKCSVCGQPGLFHIKPNYEAMTYSHHVISLEDGEFVTDIGASLSMPPSYFACEKCLQQFKANNANCDSFKFWHDDEWWRQHNLVTDAGIEFCI